MEVVVGMGEFALAGQSGDILKTFALASCVAVTAYSPTRRASGMLHVVLPAPLDSRDRVVRPGYFAETGVPLLINTLCRQYGCRREELQIRLFGGAESVFIRDVYKVGRKNIDAVKAALAEMGLAVQEADLRGSQSRTLAMEATTGNIRVFKAAM